MRDQIADQAFWKRALGFQDEDMKFFENSYYNADLDAPELSQGARGGPLFDTLERTSLAFYSAGKPMQEVVAPALRGVGHLYPEMLARFGASMPNGIAYAGFSNYHRWIAMLVLCRASNKEAAAFFGTIDQIIREQDDFGGYDNIWAAYRRHFGLGKVSVNKPVFWPKAYQYLWDAIDPEEPDFARPNHLKKFLEGWYKEMDSECSAGTGLAENLTETSNYVGYWCLEAAAASVAFNIPDKIFRDHPHYPKDWADWAR